MFCTNCGYKAEDGSKFCLNCGAILEQDAPIESVETNAYEQTQQNQMPNQNTMVSQPQENNKMQNPVYSQSAHQNNVYSQPVNPAYPPYSPVGMRGMKWFKFIIYFMLFVNIAGLLVGGISSIALSSELGRELDDDRLEIVMDFARDTQLSFEEAEDFMDGFVGTIGAFGVSCICLAVLAVIARITLGGYRKSGPLFINLYFFISSIIPYIFAYSLFSSFISIVPFDKAIYNGPSEELLTTSILIAMLIPFAINMSICFANLSYFKKRKDLFVR